MAVRKKKIMKPKTMELPGTGGPQGRVPSKPRNPIGPGKGSPGKRRPRGKK
jgi:hypothetical protein